MEINVVVSKELEANVLIYEVIQEVVCFYGIAVEKNGPVNFSVRDVNKDLAVVKDWGREDLLVVMTAAIDLILDYYLVTKVYLRD